METQAMLSIKIESLKEALPKEAQGKESCKTPLPPVQTCADLHKEVELVDTDGDNIRFVLSEDGRQVIEYVNGKVELESVTYFKIDEAKGMVFDPLGRFTLKEEDRVVKLKMLEDLFARVGIVPTRVASGQPSAPAATVEIDLDFSGSPERIMEQQRIASDAIRKACSSLGGATAEAAQNVLAHLFEAVTSGNPDQTAKTEAKAALETQTVSIPEKQLTHDEGEEKPEFKFEQQLVDVLEMGFDDIELITSLLDKYKGDVQRVVADLADHRSV